MGRSFFFRKNQRIQFDEVCDSKSNGGIFHSLAPFGGELWRFENLKFVQQLQPTQEFLGNFFVSIGRVKNFTCTEQLFIDFHYYNDLEGFFENIKKFTFLLKVKILRTESVLRMVLF